MLCRRSPILGVRDLGVISGSVSEWLCDFGQITFRFWASVSPSVKSLKSNRMPGPGGILEDGEAVRARGRWARERWPEVVTERAGNPAVCGRHCGVQGRHLGLLASPYSEMDRGGVGGGAELGRGRGAAVAGSGVHSL